MKRKGFTIIEIMVVLFILMVLFTMAFGILKRSDDTIKPIHQTESVNKETQKNDSKKIEGFKKL